MIQFLENHFVVVDVETTGFGTQDRVIEVAAVLVDWRTGSELDVVHTLIDPGRSVGSSQRVHGISDAMLLGKPKFARIAPALQGLLTAAPVVAHNVSFDKRMLTQEFRRARTGWPAVPTHCTYQLTRQRLIDACVARGIRIEQHHRALGDARATAQLFRSLTVR